MGVSHPTCPLLPGSAATMRLSRQNAVREGGRGVKVISRREWGARHPDGFGPAPVPWSEWWLHHSATVAPDLVPPWDDDDDAVRTLERIGQQRFSGGISYTFAVTPSGRIYQGHSVDRRGAHTIGHNTAGRGIVLVGNYDRDRPTPSQLDAVAWIVADYYRRGLCRSRRLTGGHRDVKGTDCPGDHAYALLPEINRRAAALLDPAHEEDDMDPKVIAEIKRDIAAHVLAEVLPRLREIRDADDRVRLADWVADAIDADKGAAMSSHELGQQAVARVARVEAAVEQVAANVDQLLHLLTSGPRQARLPAPAKPTAPGAG